MKTTAIAAVAIIAIAYQATAVAEETAKDAVREVYASIDADTDADAVYLAATDQAATKQFTLRGNIRRETMATTAKARMVAYRDQNSTEAKAVAKASETDWVGHLFTVDVAEDIFGYTVK